MLFTASLLSPQGLVQLDRLLPWVLVSRSWPVSPRKAPPMAHDLASHTRCVACCVAKKVILLYLPPRPFHLVLVLGTDFSQSPGDR